MFQTLRVIYCNLSCNQTVSTFAQFDFEQVFFAEPEQDFSFANHKMLTFFSIQQSNFFVALWATLPWISFLQQQQRKLALNLLFQHFSEDSEVEALDQEYTTSAEMPCTYVLLPTSMSFLRLRNPILTRTNVALLALRIRCGVYLRQLLFHRQTVCPHQNPMSKGSFSNVYWTAKVVKFTASSSGYPVTFIAIIPTCSKALILLL